MWVQESGSARDGVTRSGTASSAAPAADLDEEGDLLGIETPAAGVAARSEEQRQLEHPLSLI